MISRVLTSSVVPSKTAAGNDSSSGEERVGVELSAERSPAESDGVGLGVVTVETVLLGASIGVASDVPSLGGVSVAAKLGPGLSSLGREAERKRCERAASMVLAVRFGRGLKDEKYWSCSSSCLSVTGRHVGTAGGLRV
ncbi:hypothetical protein E2C01_004826 [Portunus trituberculatus]|uniref:Uncharacterized protein n=1 Tax=Portunus trituberculatus TaxID=210409 RepID=A0A5B7CSP5_PORTR|nr:hypothetical protein [Portunus trituberculatus]